MRAAFTESLAPLSASLTAALVGFGGTVALIVQMGEAAGASPLQVRSAVTALCLGIALAGAGLASTLVVSERILPLIGGVIGNWTYANFPLLAYLPWFLVGLRLGRTGRRTDGADLVLGAAASLAFALVWLQWDEIAQRFPPSVPWVLGPGLLLAGLLWLCERAPRVPAWWLAPGRHGLACSTQRRPWPTRCSSGCKRTTPRCRSARGRTTRPAGTSSSTRPRLA